MPTPTIRTRLNTLLSDATRDLATTDDANLPTLARSYASSLLIISQGDVPVSRAEAARMHHDPVHGQVVRVGGVLDWNRDVEFAG